MKAISLHQPYASAIALGLKTCETRSFAPPHSLIGQRIAIHATQNRSRANKIQFQILSGWFRESLPMLRSFDELPLGAIVCTATLSEVFGTGAGTPHTEAIDNIREIAFGDWSARRFAWKLTDVQFLIPIPFRGHQGWFTVPDDLFPGAPLES